MLIDGTHVDAVSAAIARRFEKADAFKSTAVISTGIYDLMWDLAKSEISPN